MKPNQTKLELNEEQALFFRARRGFLSGKGASTPAQCALDLLGLQAQQLAPWLLALSQRLAGRPTASMLKEWLFALGTAGELIAIECGGRKDLVALSCDEDDLRGLPGFRREAKAVAQHLEMQLGATP